jgi:Transcription- and export-related complex subunit
LASGNALILFETMIKQAREYDNMIEALNLSMASCCDLSLDICAYTIVRSVSDCKEQELDKEANVQGWLTNMAKFAALFFKKYCQVDIVGLLTYLLNKMRMDNDYN